jgi:flagellar basal-body rod protein FlgC
MNLFGLMDVSGSALTAERVRAEVVAANMANAETTRTASGGPYQRQHVVFEQAGGGFADAMRSEGVGTQGNDGVSFASFNSGFGGLSFGGGMSASAAVPGGVEVAGVETDESAAVERYDPGNPEADAKGFVAYPNINPLTEMVDLMGATRAYGMNASAVQAEKEMVTDSLDILK